MLPTLGERMSYRILDRGLDEMAAGARAGFWPRLAASVAVGLISLAFLPLRACLIWSAWVLFWDIASFFGTRDQHMGRPVPDWSRWLHVVSLVFGVAGWVTLGVLLWLTGSAAGGLCGVVIWLAVMGFAQVHAYQSRAGYLLSGVIPAVATLATPAIAPNPGIGHPWPVWFMLLATVGFKVSSAAQTREARQRYEDATEALRASERSYRLLADNVTDVIALGSPDHQRLYISPSIERILGFTPGELLDTPNYTYLHPEDAPLVPAFIDTVTLESGPGTLAYRVLHKNGSMIWAETTFSRLNDGSGRLLSVSRDVTARKALEDELKDAAHRAEAAAAAKTDFLANMTHELRTPLTAILGFADVLRQSKALNKRDARHSALIYDASQTLLGVVGDVLDYAKIEAGAFELDPEPFDPAEAVRAAVAIVAGQADAKGLSLNTAIGEAPPTLIGDAPRLRQVLLNFLSNAVKFTRDGSVEARLTYEPVGEGDVRLRVEVRDTGIGIEAQHISALFSRFTQADASVSRQFGGTGLGLAISKEIVEAMGGAIGAASTVGEGSVFWFEVVLPRAEDWAGAAEPEAAAALDRPIRALIVEDNAVNRELITTLLSPFDIEIDTACDGAEAVEAVRRGGGYDVILMDMQMPVMDGLTATRRIRALPDKAAASTPIIAMTANVLPEQVARCREAGMDDHLGKPINLPQLLAALDHWTTPRDDAAVAVGP